MERFQWHPGGYLPASTLDFSANAVKAAMAAA
jgi:hypothetical protein